MIRDCASYFLILLAAYCLNLAYHLVRNPWKKRKWITGLVFNTKENRFEWHGER